MLVIDLENVILLVLWKERKEENRGMEAGLRDIRLFFFRNGRTVRETGRGES